MIDVQGSNEAQGIPIKHRRLSERQRAILRFIEGYLHEHGHPPAIQDIGRGVGIASSSSVTYHIDRLVEWGYLSKQPGRNRTLVVLQSGDSQLDEPSVQDLHARLAALQLENRRLREWCRQLERERAWERTQYQATQIG